MDVSIEDVIDGGNAPSSKADARERLLPNPFRLTCVENVYPPEGCEGREWCGYVLRTERFTIVGHRRGS
jgi:hypothetical protein